MNADAAKDVRALKSMTVRELQQKWLEVLGEQTRTGNRQCLVKRLQVLRARASRTWASGTGLRSAASRAPESCRFLQAVVTVDSRPRQLTESSDRSQYANHKIRISVAKAAHAVRADDNTTSTYPVSSPEAVPRVPVARDPLASVSAEGLLMLETLFAE